MISLSKKYEVLQSHFVEGKGYKTIAREQELSKNTVKKYIRDYADQKSTILRGGDKSEIFLSMIEPPTYDSSSRERTVATDDILAQISRFLDENKNKRLSGKRKLCMKATDMHEELTRQNIKISYSTVCNYVRKLENRHREAFIKQHYDYGEVCEFDWGDVRLVINGQETLYKLAVFTLASSNIRYAYLYRHEDTQAFIDAHIRFFAYIDKVPHLMVYDNMKVAIAKFVGKYEKQATIALKQLSTYYGFEFRFCNIRKGNEKGHVERSVEVVRRKAFSSISEFGEESSANSRLLETINRLNSNKTELLEKEQAAMLPKMPDYSSVVRQIGLVDKFCTVVYKTNHYSVPDYLVGKKVETLVFTDEISIRVNGSEVARHKRSYEKNVYMMDVCHYGETFLRKPGALANSLCLKQSNELLKIIYEQLFRDNPKDFILVLGLLDNFSIVELRKSIESLYESGIKATFDNIKMVLHNKNHDTSNSQPDDIEKACESQLNRYAEVLA